MPSTIQPASSRIHVLEIIGNAIVGGMENSVLRLIERLPPPRFSVSALCPFEGPYSERLRAAGAEVHIVPMPDDPPWSAIHLACALIKSHAVDVLHSHLPNAHVLAGIAGRLSGKPVLATIHGRQLTPLDLEVHRSAGTHLHVVCKQSQFNALGDRHRGQPVDLHSPRRRHRCLQAAAQRSGPAAPALRDRRRRAAGRLRRPALAGEGARRLPANGARPARAQTADALRRAGRRPDARASSKASCASST